jgi:quinol monooxygenase YgiN
MSVNVLLEIKSNPEDIEKLKSTFAQILPDTRSYEGCIGVQVVVNQDNPLNIILIETWETREHYEKYLAWRVETGAIDALGRMLSEAPSIRYYDNINI